MSCATRVGRGLFPTKRLQSSSAVRHDSSRSIIANRRTFTGAARLEDKRQDSIRPGTNAPESRTNDGTASNALKTKPLILTIPRGESSNTADRLARQLREDGQLTWGFAIYRSTYTDNSEWETCLARLKTSIQKSMNFDDGMHLLNNANFKLTVFDDADLFDGSSVHDLRRDFRARREKAFIEEQGSREEVEERCEAVRREWIEETFGSVEGFLRRPVVEVDEDVWRRSMGEGTDEGKEVEGSDDGRGQSQGDERYHSPAVRYRFCVQIDEESMQSIVSSDETSDDDGWVNLVSADWHAEDAAARREQDRKQHVEMGLDPQDFDHEVEVFPAIDGCVEESVGWMRVRCGELIPDFYTDLRDEGDGGFGRLYVRPPEVGGA